MGVLDGKAAVVTGGAGLLGSEFSKALAAEGARVVINDTNADAAHALAKSIAATGGKATAFVESVDSFERAGRIIQACLDRYGRIDTLVNCAHRTLTKPIWELSQEELETTLRVHLVGHFGCARHAAAAMKKQGSGSIITMTSRALNGHAGLSTYAAAKGGIMSATLSWALELAPYGVRVNAVNPAAVRPGDGPPVRHMQWFWDFTIERMSWYAPVPGPATVAPLVVYLASDAAKSVTGQVIFLSGDTLALLRHPREERFAFKPDGWTFDDLQRYFRETVGAALEMPGMGVPHYKWYDGVGKG